MNTHDMPVTVIGLGAMGQALAAAFLKSGRRVTVWNRSTAKADSLVAAGATLAATVAEAVEASPVVVVCLLDYPVLHDILDPADWSGRALVNLTNGTPAQARETAGWAAERGAAYLDGGIMAVPPMIGQPEAFVLYSGSKEQFDRYEPLLSCLGDSKYVGTDAGLASLYDLALLSAMYGQFAGAAHAFALVGENQADFASSMLIPWLRATTFAVSPPVQADTETSPSAMQAAAIANIADASNTEGIPVDRLSHLLMPLRDLLGPRAAGQDLATLIKENVLRG